LPFSALIAARSRAAGLYKRLARKLTLLQT